MVASKRIAAEPRSDGGPSLDDLYRQHGGWLRSTIGRKLRLSPAEADDIVQDAYLRIARQPPGKIDRPRALLSQIALNLFRDRKRREAVRDDHRQSVERAAASGSSDHVQSEQETAIEIERLVLAIPDLYRDVFVLSRFRHMTNQQIAEHLGISIKTVEWRMSRALDFCVRRLEL